MKTYKVYWIFGKTEIIQGKSFLEAMRNANNYEGSYSSIRYWETLK